MNIRIALYGLVLFFAVMFVFRSGCEPIPCIDCDEEIVDPDSLVTTLNKKLSYVELVRNVLPSVCEDNGDIYEIKLQNQYLYDSYFFDKYKYTIETGGDLTEIHTSSICEIIDSLVVNRSMKIVDILNAMKVKGKINLGFLELEIDGMQWLLAEIYTIIATFGEYSEFEIYIKGFADGYGGNWKKPMSSYGPRYNYSSINYFPAQEKGSLNPLHYERTPMAYSLSNEEYENKDLPMLRAEFIKEDFILPFTKTCDIRIKGVYLLEGYEYGKTVKDPNKRKVQIFLREVCGNT